MLKQRVHFVLPLFDCSSSSFGAGLREKEEGWSIESLLLFNLAIFQRFRPCLPLIYVTKMV